MVQTRDQSLQTLVTMRLYFAVAGSQSFSHIDGTEISIDAWLDQNSRVKGLVLRYRVHVVNGESQVTKTFRDKTLEYEFANILNKLSLRGPVVMQAFIDSSRELHIIECNARFGGASSASIAVGLDSFRWSLLEAAGMLDDSHLFVRSLSEVK